MRDFQGKVVLIAGAGEKISPCLAHRFSKLGASIAVQASDDADIRNVSRLLPDDQLRSGFLSVVGDPNNVDILRKTVDDTAEKFGRIDLLVLNPEVVFKPDSMHDEMRHRHLETSATSNRQLVVLASPILKQSSGVILNLFRSKTSDLNFEQFQKSTDPITDAASGVRVEHVNLDAASTVPHPDEVTNLVVFLARKNDETLKLFSVALLTAITLFIAFFALLIGPVAQPTGYHNYADKRRLLGIPFAAYVLSNVGFTLVGGWAFWRMKNGSTAFRKNFIHPTEIQLYQAFFAIIAVTGLGSAYYHWNPNNGTLLWDRLPIAMATMALLAALITERASVPLGRMLSGPLVFFGALSSLHWWWTEFQGRGDLRLYALVTLVPALFYPLLLVAFPSNFSGTSFLVAALLCFGMARVTELNDHTIFLISGGTVGGHVLKHIFATIAVLLVAFYVRNRRPIGRGAYYLLEIQFARKAVAVGSEFVSTIKQFLRRRD